MPVQINELIVRAHVHERPEAPVGGQPPVVDNEAREEIIRECIERILELLQLQNER